MIKVMNLQFVLNHTTSKKSPEIISFHRTELTPILSVYGKMVASGEWRDYGISSLREFAVFSIFKRT